MKRAFLASRRARLLAALSIAYFVGALVSCAPSKPTVVGQYAKIGAGATVKVGAYVGPYADIGEYATVGKGVRVGEHARVEPHSKVTDDVPAYGLVKGDPAKLIGLIGRDGSVVWTAGSDGGLPPDGTVIQCPGGGELVVVGDEVQYRDLGNKNP